MKKATILTLTLIMSFTLQTHLIADTIDDLEFITENYAPLNFEKDKKLQGITVDILVEMLKLAGSKKTLADIKLWPWARGYKTAQEKKNTVLFSMTRTEAREKLFKWVGPIIPTSIVIIAKKSKKIKLDSLEDLKKYKKIGVVRDDIGELLLLEAGVDKKKIHRTISPKNTVKMINIDRIDMWAYGQIVAMWYIKEFGYNPNDYEVVYTLKESHQFYAFHKNTSDEIINKMQKALEKLKAQGTLEKIVNKYLSNK